MLKLLLLASIAAKPTQKGLYTEEDYVEILDHTNFDSAIEDESKLWIVEFYASWCGHCQHFAPVIRQWSQGVKNWGRLVHIGVIDCGDNLNHDICTKNKINGFPTMKYFPIGARDFEAKNVLDGRSEVDLTRDTIRVIKENLPKKFPISFQNLKTVEDINAHEPKDRPFVLVVGDAEHPYEAERVMSELTTFNDISIGLSLQDSCSLDQCAEALFAETVCCKYQADKLPAIIVIKNDGSDFKKIGNPDGDGLQLVAQLGDMLNIKTSHNWDQQNHVFELTEKVATDERWRDFDQSKVYLKDIESAILQLLFYDVKIFPMDAAVFSELKKIVNFLSLHYPKTSSKLQSSLANVDAEISSLNEIKKRKEWIQILAKTGLTSVQGQNPILEYAACTPSVENLRGYPCSLWTLFHFLLANSDSDTSTLQAADCIVSIVTHFFGCSECVENFKKEIVTFSPSSITDKKSGILWLWTLHNSVNKRLSGDESEDPEFPKVQWPSSSACPECHKADDDSPLADESSFNTDKVFQFILNRNQLKNLVLPPNEMLFSEITTPDDSPESSHKSGLIWFITITLVVGALWIYKNYRVKFILKQNYRKFKHQL